MLVPRNQCLGFGLDVQDFVERESLAPQVAGKKVAKLAAPQDRHHPLGVSLEQGVRLRTELVRQEQVRQDVRVHDDHRRPSRLSASMTCAWNLPCGSEARKARARARRSAGGIFPGRSTVSRQTMASLFRLRRWESAEAFSRSYTSSGMPLRVRVVGTATSKSNHSGCGGDLGQAAA